MNNATIDSLIKDINFNPQDHIKFLEQRGLAFENKEWWYLTLSGGLVTVVGSLTEMLQTWMQDMVFLAPMLVLIVTLISWYVQLNYKREYLANNMLKEEFIKMCHNKITIDDNNHPFNYNAKGEEFRANIKYRTALTHCMGKLSLFFSIVLFSIVMLVNEL